MHLCIISVQEENVVSVGGLAICILYLMLRTGAIWTVTITNVSENPIEMSFWTTAGENKVFAKNTKLQKKL